MAPVSAEFFTRSQASASVGRAGAAGAEGSAAALTGGGAAVVVGGMDGGGGASTRGGSDRTGTETGGAIASRLGSDATAVVRLDSALDSILRSGCGDGGVRATAGSPGDF